MAYVEDQTFDTIDYTEEALPRGEYESCVFKGCNFSNTNLTDYVFSSCRFVACNLSSATLSGTALKEIFFKDCKLMGLHFGNCNDFLFSVEFENCVLNLSSFCKLKLKKTRFTASSLHDVDFSGADLTEVLFAECDLHRALFENCLLEKADFRTAKNYSLDPERNRMKKAKFSLHGVVGLLDKYEIVIE